MLIALAPELVLLLSALAVLGLGVSNSECRKLPALVSLLGGLLAAGALVGIPVDGQLLHGMVLLEPLGRFFKLVLLLLTMVAVVFAAESFPARHFAESLALILFSALGMLLLVSTENLLMIFLALELTSIPLYVLAAFNKESRASAEAGLKYFLIGSVSAAFMLYGLSLLYGAAGSTSLLAIAKAPADPLLIAGIILLLGGFAFKVAAVPFQLWAPDVYEGAPTAAAALIASGSKVAAVFLLVKLLATGLPGMVGSAGWGRFVPGWAPVLALMAAGSMLLGNVSALVQKNVKRLLAYSAIAHGGYLLLGLAAGHPGVFPAVLLYVVIYALTTAGAFGVVAIVEAQSGGSDLENFRGLSKRSPLLAFSLLVFLISLAGIPPLAGFFGKFYLFAAALQNGSMLWLVVLALILNAVSLYYYLIVLKNAFVLPAQEIPERVSGQRGSRVLVALLAVAVLVLGIAPGLLLKPILNQQRAVALNKTKQ